MLTYCTCFVVENLAFLTNKMDFCKAELFPDYDFDHMNLQLPAVYILAALAGSQSMSKFGYEFKSVRNSDSIMCVQEVSYPARWYC